MSYGYDVKDFIAEKCSIRAFPYSRNKIYESTINELKDIALSKFNEMDVNCLFDYYETWNRNDIEEKYNIDTRTFFRKKQRVAEYIATYFDDLILRR